MRVYGHDLHPPRGPKDDMRRPGRGRVDAQGE